MTIKKKKNIKISKKRDDNDPVTKGEFRQLGVMMENMQDTISFVAETVVGLSERMDRFEIKVDNVETKVNSIDHRLFNVEYDIRIIKSDTSDIKFDLKRKVYMDEFLTLVKRVERLETKK